MVRWLFFHLLILKGDYSIVELPVKEIPNGTYELVGPKVQGNPYKFSTETKVGISVCKKGMYTSSCAKLLW